MPAIEKQCPGQNTMFWRPDDIYDVACPHCDRPVEFFKTDLKRKCPHCGGKFLNPKVNFSCAEWCEHAEECLGPATYGQMAEKWELERKRAADLERLLGIIPSQDGEAKTLFEKLYRENTDSERLLDVRLLRLLRDDEPSLVERAMKYYRQFAEEKS